MKVMGIVYAALMIGYNAIHLDQDFSTQVFRLNGPIAEDVLSGMSADVEISYQDSEMKW